MDNIDFKQYIGQPVQVGFVESNTTLQATLKGVSEYGVLLADSKTPALTFATRFYSWNTINYIDWSPLARNQAA